MFLIGFNFIFSDLSYPDFKQYGIWSLRVSGGARCWRYFSQPVSMTRAAYRICEALHQSRGGLCKCMGSFCNCRESPIYRRRIISLINKVHAYRNRIFHSLTPFHSHDYHFTNGEWKHYWERIQTFGDSQWGSIELGNGRTLYINVSDLYSKDEWYIENVRGESQ